MASAIKAPTPIPAINPREDSPKNAPPNAPSIAATAITIPPAMLLGEGVGFIAQALPWRDLAVQVTPAAAFTIGRNKAPIKRC